MRMVKMKYEGIDGTATFPESAITHWERAGWTVVDSDAGEFAAPENRPPTPPGEPEPSPSQGVPGLAAGDPAPESSSEAPQNTRRRLSPRPEGSA